MVELETVHELVEDLADKFGIYNIGPEHVDHPENCEFLEDPGDYIAISPGADGFDFIRVGVAWDNMQVKKSGTFGRIFMKMRKVGVDLDIGCLYELVDGTRGSLQAFGSKFGNFDAAPFVSLSGDERTGNGVTDIKLFFKTYAYPGY